MPIRCPDRMSIDTASRSCVRMRSSSGRKVDNSKYPSASRRRFSDERRWRILEMLANTREAMPALVGTPLRMLS
jgi:hypothetical protein